MRVAIVCDWLTNVGGAEKVLLAVHKMYPKAPIYTSQYDPKGIDWFRDADVRTGWMQKFPARLRKLLGPLRQRYFSRLDLSGYDLVISVTGAEAKAVRAPSGVHICYCHAPTQYYWQMYDDYMKNPGFGLLNPLVRLGFWLMVKPLKRADLKAAQGVDYFVTISEYTKGLIKKYYGRGAEVIHPPVDVADFATRLSRTGDGYEGEPQRSLRRGGREYPAGSVPGQDPNELPPWSGVEGDYYITTSRQVTWKRLDLAVKAAIMTQRPLLVVGEGPEHKRLVKLAGGSHLVKFLPLTGKKELAELLAQARGYLFPSLEPFGIAPVEALASGCPVIAYGVGGARDYVKDGKNGILFGKQNAKSLAEAILKFEKMRFNREKVAQSVKGFGAERFDRELRNFIKKCEARGGKK